MGGDEPLKLEPGGEPKAGLVEDGAGGHRDHGVAGSTVALPVAATASVARPATGGTLESFAPPEPVQVVTTVVVGREPRAELVVGPCIVKAGGGRHRQIDSLAISLQRPDASTPPTVASPECPALSQSWTTRPRAPMHARPCSRLRVTWRSPSLSLPAAIKSLRSESGQ